MKNLHNLPISEKSRSGSLLSQYVQKKKECSFGAQIEKRPLPNGGITYRARIRLQGMPDISASLEEFEGGFFSKAKIGGTGNLY